MLGASVSTKRILGGANTLWPASLSRPLGTAGCPGSGVAQAEARLSPGVSPPPPLASPLRMLARASWSPMPSCGPSQPSHPVVGQQWNLLPQNYR